MKRNNGGYVLVYVVVVIVILCILVPAACANSLQNLKAQQASIERMQQLYTAEGKIERFYAEIKAHIGEIKDTKKTDALQTSEYVGKEAQSHFKRSLEAAANDIILKVEWEEKTSWQDGENASKCVIEVETKSEDVKITAVLIANLTIEVHSWSVEGTENPPTSETYYYSYEITDCTITYESYDISATTESGSQGGGT